MYDIKRAAINNDIRYQYKGYCCDDACLVIHDMPHPNTPSGWVTYQVTCANCGWFTMHTQKEPMDAPSNDELIEMFLRTEKQAVRKGGIIYLPYAYDVYWLERYGLLKSGKVTKHNIRHGVQPYIITAQGHQILDEA